MSNVRPNRSWSAWTRGVRWYGMLFGLVACAGEAPTANVRGTSCTLNPDLLVASLAPNSIRALSEPDMVGAGDPGTEYLADSDRVLGVHMNGEARAYPHNILWHHEIVSDRIGNDWVAVTFCPLTGSGVGFDPEIGARRLDLGVSGLLFANNLVLYDRTTEGLYGPQLSIEATCDAFQGQSLELLPVQEMSWSRWKGLYPDTKVVSSDIGLGRNYRVYPYGSYKELTSNELLFDMSVDRTRLIKERVLAIRDGSGGQGYPYGELRELGSVAAVNDVVGGVPTVVFYEEDHGGTALAFDARVQGRVLTFDAGSSGSESGGVWTDRETGSTWTVDGLATSGPLVGARLPTRADAFTLFWFAWRHFQPDGRTFTAR